jgi:hypothetical protein
MESFVTDTRNWELGDGGKVTKGQSIPCELQDSPDDEGPQHGAVAIGLAVSLRLPSS